jgi:hypothetical protein
MWFLSNASGADAEFCEIISALVYWIYQRLIYIRYSLQM